MQQAAQELLQDTRLLPCHTALFTQVLSTGSFNKNGVFRSNGATDAFLPPTRSNGARCAHGYYTPRGTPSPAGLKQYTPRVLQAPVRYPEQRPELANLPVHRCGSTLICGRTPHGSGACFCPRWRLPEDYSQQTKEYHQGAAAEGESPRPLPGTSPRQFYALQLHARSAVFMKQAAGASTRRPTPSFL